MIVREVAEQIRSWVKEHHKWFSQCLPMIASENVISPLSQEMLMCDFHGRYAEGHPGARYYQGCTYIDMVERKCEEMAKEIFNCEWVDVRPISGTTANLAVLFALAKPGEKLTTVDVPHGAHISSERFGAVGVRGLERYTYPFDIENMNIDIDGTIKVIQDVRPKIALFGQSVFLFPIPLKDLQDALHEVDAHVVYDAAHVLGLIAGGKFQDPLREGAHVVTGSTHKTLPGPQRGIILANPKNEKMRRKLDFGVFPGVVSNHHLHTLAALGVALAECIAFGKEYAEAIVRNAQTLGEAMYEIGFKVLCPHLKFTESHTLAVDVRDVGGGTKISEDFEKANIIINKNLMPWDHVDTAIDPSGIRLGVQELTRLGMGPNEMKFIAEIMKKIAIDGKKPEDVKDDVIELRKEFNTIKYCFHRKEEAYKYYQLFE